VSPIHSVIAGLIIGLLNYGRMACSDDLGKKWLWSVTLPGGIDDGDNEDSSHSVKPVSKSRINLKA
jgi:hypothetical protein